MLPLFSHLVRIFCVLLLESYDISPLQCGFLEECQILDPILIAKETVEVYSIGKKKRWIIRLDLEKAFNRVDWKF